jgi:uncharacterized DUF497 family protein
MEIPAEFERDSTKAAADEAKHNVSFEAAAAVFADRNRIDIDASHDEDGEIRRKAIGLIEGRLFTIVYTTRGDVCRLISARRSNAKEGRIYDNRSLQAESE